MIKNPGQHNSPVKLAKAITSWGSSYEGEIEAIKLGTDYAFQNIGLFVYTDSQSAIKARPKTGNPTTMKQLLKYETA